MATLRHSRYFYRMCQLITLLSMHLDLSYKGGIVLEWLG
jgi:hypothetical protein